MTDKKALKKETWLFGGALLLLFAIFAWRQFYGFNKNDEIFYISTVYRFFQGDAMLVDEWNNVQMFAFITYPLFSFFRLFQNSNEGIVLFFRFAYLIFQALVSLYCFCRLKRFGWARILPALFYFVTTPYNINGLSYNALAFGFVLLTLVTLSGPETLRVRDSLLCGFFVAGAVLANPYAIILFLAYGIVCAGAYFAGRKKEKITPDVLSVKSFFWMGVGAFIICVLFLLFVFSRGTLEEIMECFTYIVMDTERQKSFLEKLGKYFIRIHRYYPGLVYATGLIVVLWLIDRGKRISREFCLAVEMAVTVPYILYYGFFWEMVGINYMLIPMAFPGLIAWLVTEKRDWRLFWFWYVPGLAYTLIAHFATNTGILTVSASYMIVSAASMLLLCRAMEEQKSRVWLNYLLALLFLVQFAGCIWQRVTYVWGDDHLEELTCRMTEGPLKGIYTTEENVQLYGEVLADMEELALSEDDQLFVLGIAPWMYLNTEAKCAAYSTWETLETDPLISIYYEIRPEKLPTVVYCYEYDEEILETEFADYFMEMGYEPVFMQRGIALVRR